MLFELFVSVARIGGAIAKGISSAIKQRDVERGIYKSAATHGYGADRFASIVNAHSDPEEIVEIFELDQPNNIYNDYWEQCERQMIENCIALTEAMEAEGDEDVDPEDLYDYEEVEERAHEMALEQVERWLTKLEWIPPEVLWWAYYEVSSHNG